MIRYVDTQGFLQLNRLAVRRPAPIPGLIPGKVDATPFLVVTIGVGLDVNNTQSITRGGTNASLNSRWVATSTHMHGILVAIDRAWNPRSDMPTLVSIGGSFGTA